ncbi:MAG: hypothetical protein MRK02_01500 [Candidatus Scalindua sp.]|nr:hypothetical protein [Candidatus Scalindua sp.]
MTGKLDVEKVKAEILCAKDATLKSIIDIVAYKISMSLHDQGPEKNILAAEETLGAYIAANFSCMDEFYKSVSKIDKGIKGIQDFAYGIYESYSEKDHLSFNSVKESISGNKDFILKTITDIVAYKISQSPNDKGPEMNFITAETFVAEYISKFFRSKMEFEKKLAKLGRDMKGLRIFSDTVYDYFVSGKE